MLAWILSYVSSPFKTTLCNHEEIVGGVTIGNRPSRQFVRAFNEKIPLLKKGHCTNTSDILYSVCCSG